MANSKTDRKRFQLFQQNGYLNPAIFQILGILLLIGFCVYWGFDHSASPLLVGAALTLIGIGSAGGALITVKQDITERGDQHARDLRLVEPPEHGDETASVKKDE